MRIPHVPALSLRKEVGLTLELGFAPNEDPFVIVHGGFYRRWYSMIDDISELESAVARLEGTTQDKWVPVWEELGRRHEAEGDRLEATGDFDGSRRSYLQAKTYYAIGRFPGEVSEVKRRISDDCARAVRNGYERESLPGIVLSANHHQVAIIERGCMNTNHYLACRGRRVWAFGHNEVVESE